MREHRRLLTIVNKRKNEMQIDPDENLHDLHFILCFVYNFASLETVSSSYDLTIIMSELEKRSSPTSSSK